MSVELIAFLNFSFEKKETSIKVADDNGISHALRWKLNWGDYLSLLSSLGVDASSDERPSLMRYGQPMVATDVFNDLITFQSTLRTSLTEMIRTAKISNGSFKRIFGETDGITIKYRLPEDFSDDVTPQNISRLRLGACYETLTYRIYIMAILRELIVAGTIFDLQVSDDGVFYYQEPDYEAVDGYCGPSPPAPERFLAEHVQAAASAISEAVNYRSLRVEPRPSGEQFGSRESSTSEPTADESAQSTASCCLAASRKVDEAIDELNVPKAIDSLLPASPFPIVATATAPSEVKSVDPKWDPLEDDSKPAFLASSAQDDQTEDFGWLGSGMVTNDAQADNEPWSSQQLLGPDNIIQALGPQAIGDIEPPQEPDVPCIFEEPQGIRPIKDSDDPVAPVLSRATEETCETSAIEASQASPLLEESREIDEREDSQGGFVEQLIPPLFGESQETNEIATSQEQQAPAPLEETQGTSPIEPAEESAALLWLEESQIINAPQTPSEPFESQDPQATTGSQETKKTWTPPVYGVEASRTQAFEESSVSWPLGVNVTTAATERPPAAQAPRLTGLESGSFSGTVAGLSGVEAFGVEASDGDLDSDLASQLTETNIDLGEEDLGEPLELLERVEDTDDIVDLTELEEADEAPSDQLGLSLETSGRESTAFDQSGFQGENGDDAAQASEEPHELGLKEVPLTEPEISSEEVDFVPVEFRLVTLEYRVYRKLRERRPVRDTGYNQTFRQRKLTGF
jgi:hypothetical protein